MKLSEAKDGDVLRDCYANLWERDTTDDVDVAYLYTEIGRTTVPASQFDKCDEDFGPFVRLVPEREAGP